MLYGKFGFMQLEVTNDNLFAAGDPGRGAVIKLPVLLLDSEYLYWVEGFKFLNVTAAVKSVLLSSLYTVPS
jgi:hypothetical protein